MPVVEIMQMEEYSSCIMAKPLKEEKATRGSNEGGDVGQVKDFRVSTGLQSGKVLGPQFGNIQGQFCRLELRIVPHEL